MKESLASRLTRHAFNLWPCYFGTGGRLTFISHDYRHARIALDLKLRTYNYFGTIFGGSIYGSVDPIYAILLMKCLGPEYVAWDKAASIRFRRPGREKLFAEFHLNQKELQDIRKILKIRKSVDRVYRIELKDKEGNVHAEIEQTVFVARKRPESSS